MKNFEFTSSEVDLIRRSLLCLREDLKETYKNIEKFTFEELDTIKKLIDKIGN